MSLSCRLGFTHIPRRLWAGGFNYQKHLFAALNKYFPGEFSPVVFAGNDAEPGELSELAAVTGVSIVQRSNFDRQQLGLAQALLIGLDVGAAKAFAAQEIDVIIENARFFGRRLPIPSIAWFPDIQHRRLPDLFTRGAWWKREIGFKVQISSGRWIMLSSLSAQKDCRTFYPAMKGRSSVVRFATEPPSQFLDVDPRPIIAKYNLEPGFLYLPNQFWRHKNQQIVVDALAILADRGIEAVVAASGSREGLREQGYFEGVMHQVEARGLDRSFRYLGMIPLVDVYALLRTSASLINPSRFEGWSTTVEEAKSFGVPMLLSDIDVHREQTANKADYFGVDDPVALADHIEKVVQKRETLVVRDLQENLDQRVHDFAAAFADTVRRAISDYRR